MSIEGIDSRIIVPFTDAMGECDKLGVVFEGLSLHLVVGIDADDDDDWNLEVTPETVLTLADFIETALEHLRKEDLVYSDSWLLADGVEYCIEQSGDELPLIITITLRSTGGQVAMFLTKNIAGFLVNSMRRIAGLALRYPNPDQAGAAQ